MNTEKILLHDLKKSIGKHIIIFIISLITLVVAIVAVSFEKITTDIRVSQLKESTLSEEILIEPADYNNTDKIAAVIEDVPNIDKVVYKAIVNVKTDINDDDYRLYGVDYDIQNELSAIPLLRGNNYYSTDNGVMISSELADRESLDTGDIIKVTYDGKESSLTITGICDKECALFDNFDICLLVDRKTVEEICGFNANRLDLSLNDLVAIDETVEALSEKIAEDEAEIYQKYDSSYYNSFVSTIALSLKIFVIFSAVMSVYLMYSLYRSLIIGQTHEMAVLRTVGMTINGYICFILKQTVTIFLFSAAASYFLSRIMIKLLLHIFAGVEGEVNIDLEPVKLIVVYSVFFIISVFSVIAAVRKQASLKITELIKTRRVVEKRRIIKIIIGIILLPVSAVLNHYYDEYSACLIISLVLALVAMISLSDIIINAVIALFERFRINKMTLGVKQLKPSKSNYSLVFNLSSFVIVLFIIAVSVSGSLSSSIGKIYGDADIYSEVYTDDIDAVYEGIKKDDLITDKICLIRGYTELDDASYMIEAVPVDIYKNKDYENVYREKASHAELFDRLNEKGTVIISSTIAKKQHLKRNEEIELSGKKVRIAGIAATYENMGKMIFTSKETFDDLAVEQNSSLILMNCSDKDKAVEKIESYYDSTNVSGYAMTLDDLFRSNNERNQLIINIIKILSCFIGAVAVICLYNTIVICMKGKLGDYVILRTVGGDKRSILMTELMESAVNSACNFIFALIFGYYINIIVQKTVSFYFGEGERLFCDIKNIILIALIVLASYLICKIVVLKTKLFRTEIVESIKESAV